MQILGRAIYFHPEQDIREAAGTADRKTDAREDGGMNAPMRTFSIGWAWARAGGRPQTHGRNRASLLGPARRAPRVAAPVA
ncbi:hypothetical protein GCM10010994_25150 [Chelatococcus reniformis]|uniref:Uncharacterized protein n=1 Tax=Chelatococcus reniformis TaxID=1494448 RepID=A0A916UAU5_9HYPH|nr:hypothetical protein GCM10010994_25150 [Chelatococcus reniformis]